MEVGILLLFRFLLAQCGFFVGISIGVVVSSSWVCIATVGTLFNFFLFFVFLGVFLLLLLLFYGRFSSDGFHETFAILILVYIFARKNLFQKDWEYESVHTGIVLLAISQWAALPVRNLLFLAYLLLGDPFADGRETESTILFEIGVLFLIDFLNIDEIRNLFDESHMRKVFAELAYVAWESGANNVSFRIRENLAEEVVKLLILGKSDHVDDERFILPGNLQ